MKHSIRHLLLALGLLSTFNSQLSTAVAQGTAFTYQGRLNDGANPASGIYDVRFTIYDSNGGPGVVAGPLTNSPVAVSNGLFTVTLDFGSGVFTGADRWLEIAVRTNGGGVFTALSPRQQITATPYALYAPNAGTAASANSVAVGSISTAALAVDAVDSSRVADGSISAGDLSPALASNTFWRLSGNAGTTAGAHFLGTTDNQPVEIKVGGFRALRLEDNGDGPDAGSVPDGAPNVIAGSPSNLVGPGVVGATISGGGATNYIVGARPNVVLAHYATVGGGFQNEIASGAQASQVAGGQANTIQEYASDSTIGGGSNNRLAASSWWSTIAGGSLNVIGTNVTYGSIGGGRVNNIGTGATGATVAGGGWNNIGANSTNSAIGGGYDNNISDGAPTATIAGGDQNVIGSGSAGATIAGGSWNDIAATSTHGVIGGGYDNSIAANSPAATIAGGRQNSVATNSANSTIGGGNGNLIRETSPAATIGGGLNNEIQINSSGNVISGGTNNAIEDYTAGSTIGGGAENRHQGGAIFGTIGGGLKNLVNGNYAVISGGQSNRVSSPYATIGGGILNTIYSSSDHSTIAGGWQNVAGGLRATIGGGVGNSVADAFAGTISGGAANQIGMYADYGVIPGGYSNQIAHTADYAFAAGRRARAIHSGTFVWADGTDAAFQSTETNQFNIRAAGGVRIQSDRGVNLNGFDGPLITRSFNLFADNAPAAKTGLGRWGLFMEPSRLTLGIPSNDIPNRFFQVAKYAPNGAYTTLMLVNQNGDVTATSFNPTSDRNAKENFAPVSAREVLDKVTTLPIHRWNFKGDAAASHVGPMAQDFRAAFGLGADDKHIATVDADGVALAAIQGLNEKLTEELKRRDAENAELKARLEALETIIRSQKPN